MNRDIPKQAFAAREAYEALRDLKKLVDEAAKTTHAAEMESFHAAVYRGQDDHIRRSLQAVLERLESPDFDRLRLVAREKLETAVSV